MQKIGVTGSIGSGKSLVCSIFKQLGAPIYNADERAKLLMITHTEIISTVKTLFGNESYFKDGSLNKAHISAIAFNNKTLLTELNKTVHPIVFADFDNWILEQKKLGVPYIIKEAALMFETDSYKGLEKFIVVTSPLQLRIERTMHRDKITQEQVQARMNNQFTQEEKLAKATFEIINDDKHSLIEQVVKLNQQFV
ncbi:MAG: dephospho-CoA kinase [Bacteroidia bacterium]|nr:dephospho-CoA kinase [Bacteroidia bacterium]